jgi:hypothetical protein
MHRHLRVNKVAPLDPSRHLNLNPFSWEEAQQGRMPGKCNKGKFRGHRRETVVDYETCKVRISCPPSGNSKLQ